MSKEVIDILKNGLKEAINEDCTLKLKIEGCKILLDYINQLETNRDEAIEYIKEHIKYECDNAFNGMQFYSYHLYDFSNKKLLSILERGKE